MNSTDKLKQQCLFDFDVSVDGGEERFSHIFVLSGVVLDAFEFVHVVFGQSAGDLIPDLLLVEFLLDGVAVSFFLFLLLLGLEFVELVVLYLDVDGNEDKFIAEVSHALNACDSALAVSNTSCLVAAGCQLGSFSWLQHA